MDATDFTRDKTVSTTIDSLVRLMDRKVISDIVDDAGHQYVDLVMEGGGVLGVALLGYTYALEQAGVRFLGIGGTSAGSIIALLLAAIAEKHQDKSERLIAAIASKDFKDFVDGDSDARDFIDAALEKAGVVRLAFKGAQVIDNVTEDLGLNPGTEFLNWMRGLLAEAGILTSADLEARMKSEPPGGLRRRGRGTLSARQKEAHLALIAADVTTETKVEFPRMADLYWDNPHTVNPALFVRASMSIPFFFHPFRVKNIPQGTSAQKRWETRVSYSGTIPGECLFMDGGIMSNFPIDVFHQPLAVPAAPTLGVKLGSDRRQGHSIKGPGNLAGAVFNSARHCLDYDFITRNPDYRQLVTCIDTGSHNWLNFSLASAEKIDLFRRGVQAAAHFLEEFKWDRYKDTRQHLAEAYMSVASQERVAMADVTEG